MYNDTKRDNCPKFYALSCFYSHRRVEKRVCPLSHIHIVVEFRSLAGGRTCLFSLCMAQTGVSQLDQIQGVKGNMGGRGSGGRGSGLAL